MSLAHRRRQPPNSLEATVDDDVVLVNNHLQQQQRQSRDGRTLKGILGGGRGQQQQQQQQQQRTVIPLLIRPSLLLDGGFLIQFSFWLVLVLWLTVVVFYHQRIVARYEDNQGRPSVSVSVVLPRPLTALRHEQRNAGVSWNNRVYEPGPFPVVFPSETVMNGGVSTIHTTTLVKVDAALPLRDKLRAKMPNYNGLEIPTLSQPKRFAAGRTIPLDDNEVYHVQTKQFLSEMDENAGGLSGGTLSRKEPDRLEHWDELNYPRPNGICYRPKWSYDVKPNCNAFHEVSLNRPVGANKSNPLQSLYFSYLGRGTFRQTWLLEDQSTSSTNNKVPHQQRDEFVLKLMAYEKDADVDSYSLQQVQHEALVFLATVASNRTMSIYGHCGISVLVEKGKPLGSIVKNWSFGQPVAKLEKPQKSSFTPPQMLHLALVMAEGVAEMHGHSRGAIAHHDLSFEQWLYDKQGLLKLNDFNKARILPWDPNQQRYCTFLSHQNGVYRAAEEIVGGPTNESADVVSMGGMMYSILTGLMPYAQKASTEEAAAAVVAAEPPLISDYYRSSERSVIERRLVEIIEKCWPHDESDRVDIFQVVRHLRETARLANVHVD